MHPYCYALQRLIDLIHYQKASNVIYDRPGSKAGCKPFFFILNICFSILRKLLTRTTSTLASDFLPRLLLFLYLILLQCPVHQLASPISHQSLHFSKWGHTREINTSPCYCPSALIETLLWLIEFKTPSPPGVRLGWDKRLKQPETLSFGQIECSSCSKSSLSLPLGVTSDSIKS